MSDARSGSDAPAPATPAEARQAVSALRTEDARRQLLTDDRQQTAKVHDLLERIGFALGRREAVVVAIVERRGDDATRWLLDELLAIADDPTTDVAAVLSHRIRRGALAAADQASAARSASHHPQVERHRDDLDVGDPDCGCLSCRAVRRDRRIQGADREAQTATPTVDPHRLRRMIEGELRRAAGDVAAAIQGVRGLGGTTVTVDDVERVAAELQAEAAQQRPMRIVGGRSEIGMRRLAPSRLAPQQRQGAAAR